MYSYDACGRILSVKDESGESSGVSTDVYYSYDALGRLLSETNGGRTHFYQYDLANRRVKGFYGSTSSIFESSTFTHTLDYAYNTNGKISAITDQKGRVTSYTYDLNGNVVAKANPNGYTITNTYDALNRLKRRSDSLERLLFIYHYDLAGNLVGFLETCLGSGVYSMNAIYDAFDRIRNSFIYDSSIYRNEFFTYDRNGNRLTRSYLNNAPGDNYHTDLTYTVNSLNQVTSIFESKELHDSGGSTPTGEVIESEITLEYNTRGNVVSYGTQEERTNLTYDAFDMLESTEVLGSDESVVRETSNAYDYRGRRISHIENEDETQYSYGDGVSVLETKDAKTTLFYRGSDQGGGVGGINYAEYSDGSELNYKIYNLRGDVVLTLSEDNTIKSKDRYFAFGEHISRGGDIKTDRHRANTKVEDSGNLLNEGKRFRQLEYGIFLTPDPLEYVDGYNPYIYCSQNPWGKWDPLGLEGEPSYWEEYKYAFKQQGASIVSLGLDFIPFVSTAKSAAELVSGNDVVTGEDIPRWVSVAGLIPFGKFASKGVKAAGQELVEESVVGAVKNAEDLQKNAEKINIHYIYISRKKSPESVKHLEDTDSIEKEFTVDRMGAKERRRENLKNKRREPNKDRDEAPPAVFKESNNADVRNIASSDNRSAGAQIGNQLRKIQNGEKVKIKVKE